MPDRNLYNSRLARIFKERLMYLKVLTFAEPCHIVKKNKILKGC